MEYSVAGIPRRIQIMRETERERDGSFRYWIFLHLHYTDGYIDYRSLKKDR